MKRSIHRSRYLWLLGAVISIYLIVSYLILPATWARIEHEPGLSKRPMVTSTAQGIPGDAINVGLIGTKEDVVSAFHAAGWYPADPVTLRTSLEIIGSVLLDRSYKDAPVSPLYFDGRREDLAFEKPAGTSADRRQHVRLWLVLQSGADGSPVWLGSASFDSGVTLSRDTGQVTHKIAPNIDAERDRLIAELNQGPNGDKHVSDQGSRPYVERSQRRRRPLLHRRRDMGGETGGGWPKRAGAARSSFPHPL